MRLRRFTAPTTGEALRKVKDALGAEALILATRPSADGEIEVTAAVDLDDVVDPIGPCGDRTGGTADALAGATPLELALVHRHLESLATRVRRMDRCLQEMRGYDAPLGSEGVELAERLELGGLARHLATPIAAAFERERSSGQPREAALRSSMLEHLPVSVSGELPRVVAFVGPTGSGKTTTIAKLAAQQRLAGQASIGLVMADGYRVGAAEQLAAYARLLELPIRTARDQREMHAAIDDLADRDVVLVDTSGLGGDGESAREIEALLAGAGEPVGVAMVVSATASARSLWRAWLQLARLAPQSCVVTKVDECGAPGDVFSWLAEVGVPLRWLGTGTRVPGDLAEASGETLVQWLTAA